MSYLGNLQVRLRNVSRDTRIAIAAAATERVRPLYEEAMELSAIDAVRRAVELGWTAASRREVNDEERNACLDETIHLANELAEDAPGLLEDTVNVAARLLEALTPDDEEHLASVARALALAQAVAEQAEIMANSHTPDNEQAESALAEERNWQDRAINLIKDWKGLPTRNMFDALGPKTPRWLDNWRTRTAGHSRIV